MQKIINPCTKCKTECNDTHRKICKKLRRAKAKARKLRRGCFWCSWRDGIFCNAGDFEFNSEESATEERMKKNIIGFACESFVPRKEIFLFR